MALFLVTPIADPGMTLAQIKEQFPDSHYEIPRTHSVFVVFKGTTKELSDKLGFVEKSISTGVVTAVSNLIFQ